MIGSEKNTHPISIEKLSALRRFNNLRTSHDGNYVFWLESIDGQGVIFQQDRSGQVVKTSAECDVRGTVGYGGGEFDIGNTKLVFVDRSGALYQFDIGKKQSLQQIKLFESCIASPAISPDEQWVLLANQKDEIDRLVLTSIKDTKRSFPLVEGADFYMNPVWHPAGNIIAWVEWNHPHMPWDASRVKLGTISDDFQKLYEESIIDGCVEAAASQPRFSPDGRWLSYIKCENNWDSLVLYDLKSNAKIVLIPPQGFHLAMPDWIQGQRSYVWSHDSRAIYYFRYARGKTTLWQIDISSGHNHNISLESVRWAAQIDEANGKILFFGSTAREPKQIWQITGNRLFLLQENRLCGVNANSYSEPQEINFHSLEGIPIYGIYFTPTGHLPDNDQIPPLVLDIHGGPTMQEALVFSSDAAFFTSRGFAYAQINYRGSSGYGYNHQRVLKHQWGVVDVEDTFAFARELIRHKFADPRQMIIKGSSAGGFTALNALIQAPGFFKAAVCSYPVSNLIADAQHTHKFERFYHRFLSGDLENDYQRFVERSPIFHIDRIQDALLLFHGAEDSVVPVSQSRQIYQQLCQRGIPCYLHIYAGEGHGFRKPETIQEYYHQIEFFLSQYIIK